MSFSWRCDTGDPISFVAVLLIASPSMLLICAVTCEVSPPVPMTADSASWAAWGLVAVLILLFLLGLPPASDASTVLVMGVPALAALLLLELSLAAVAVFCLVQPLCLCRLRLTRLLGLLGDWFRC
jgi:hypothetical protein